MHEAASVLLMQAAGGERSALDAMIVEHLPELRGYVDRRLGRAVRAREQVSDVVQSVCRELIARRSRFHTGGMQGFRRWMYATALRKVLDKDRLHTAQRRDVRREALLALWATGQEPGTPSQVAIGSETAQALVDALERLPADQRRVILLARLGGQSRAELACALGRSEAGVRNLLNRALARLAADLGASAAG